MFTIRTLRRILLCNAFFLSSWCITYFNIAYFSGILLVHLLSVSYPTGLSCHSGILLDYLLMLWHPNGLSPVTLVPHCIPVTQVPYWTISCHSYIVLDYLLSLSYPIVSLSLRYRIGLSPVILVSYWTISCHSGILLDYLLSLCILLTLKVCFKVTLFCSVVFGCRYTP